MKQTGPHAARLTRNALPSAAPAIKMRPAFLPLRGPGLRVNCV